VSGVYGVNREQGLAGPCSRGLAAQYSVPGGLAAQHWSGAGRTMQACMTACAACRRTSACAAVRRPPTRL
jgi:hypothetical protein